MNAEFVVYDIASGRGLYRVSIPDVPAWRNLYYDSGRAIWRGTFDPKTHYMSGGSPVERPASVAVCDRSDITADGEDVATISGLPVPCTVEIAGHVSAEIEVADGLLEFTAATPGDYRITIEAFPVQRYEVIIHAV